MPTQRTRATTVEMVHTNERISTQLGAGVLDVDRRMPGDQFHRSQWVHHDAAAIMRSARRDASPQKGLCS